MDKHLIPRVGIGRVDYSSAKKLQSGVRQLLDQIGDITNIHWQGARVLIKPDLMLGYPMRENPTTHPELVAAVGRLVQQLGGHVVLGDSPFILDNDIKDFWRKTGMYDIAEREDFELIGFEKAGSEAVAVETHVYYVSKAALNADIVINLPRLKGDLWTGFAGAVRNMLGVLPGFQKGLLFKRAASSKAVAKTIVDVFSVIKPAISIVDALEFTPGEQVDSREGFLLAASDAVALDTVLGHILGLDPHKTFTTRYAADAGLGIGWMEGIKLEGEPLETVRFIASSSRLALPSSFIPGVAMTMAEPFVWMHSDVNEQRCDGCGDCVAFCPTKALHFENGSNRPVIKRNLCINCWAGFSNCPRQAIAVTKSRMLNKLFRG